MFKDHKKFFKHINRKIIEVPYSKVKGVMYRELVIPHRKDDLIQRLLPFPKREFFHIAVDDTFTAAFSISSQAIGIDETRFLILYSGIVGVRGPNMLQILTPYNWEGPQGILGIQGYFHEGQKVTISHLGAEKWYRTGDSSHGLLMVSEGPIKSQ